jgi:hypothetical protein
LFNKVCFPPIDGTEDVKEGDYHPQMADWKLAALLIWSFVGPSLVRIFLIMRFVVF